jgi:hypothetical protein
VAGEDLVNGPGGDRDESEETREGGRRKPDGWKYEADAKEGKARVANEARRYLRHGRELLARGDYEKAIDALGRSGGLAEYSDKEAGAAIAAEAERSIALALKGMKDVKKEEEKLKTQLEGQLQAADELDYGQKKLLERITKRPSRTTQAAATPDVAGLEAPSPPLKVPRPVEAIRPPTEPDKEPAKPDDAGPADMDRPEGRAGKAPRLPESTRYRYSPVRGGRQKGALPIAFDLPRDAGLPYVFHRPVTGSALAEIELDCRPAADSNTARGVLVLGVLGLLGLVGGAVARRRR